MARFFECFKCSTSRSDDSNVEIFFNKCDNFSHYFKYFLNLFSIALIINTLALNIFLKYEVTK